MKVVLESTKPVQLAICAAQLDTRSLLVALAVGLQHQRKHPSGGGGSDFGQARCLDIWDMGYRVHGISFTILST